ncbi:MAG: hypothetical protein K8R57_07865 [Verrucomicrobia bacterium]|nr:hypothetical protein [Verrucomicrobiota bacterium]
MSGKRYYGYQGGSGHRRGGGSKDGLFGWTVFIFLLLGFVFLCWMGSYYIFANPEKAANYRLLIRMHKIEPPIRFEITLAPRGEFLKPGQLLERFGSMTTSEIRRANSNLLRHFIRNYHQVRELVPYAVGTYRVLGTLPLTDETFCKPGLVALLQAVEQPEVLLEQPFTAQEKDLPGLKRSLVTGQQIKLEKPLDLSAVVHIERLSENKILLTTMPLLYGTYGAAKGEASFSLEPPEGLNLEAGLPIISSANIAKLSGGKITGDKEMAGKNGEKPSGHLSRIAEEMATPTPEPRIAKAIPVKQSRTVEEVTTPIARAIPVNEPTILPAIPVSTPIGADSSTAVPRAIPVGTPLPTPTPIPTPISTPIATPTPKASPKPSAIPSGPLPTNAAAMTATNQPVATTPSEIWPVFEPGKMPRGRLVESSDAQDIASRGIGGERHYLKGHFAVTASGNGRAVLRPQGAIAGVPLGPNAKVRVIVEFPAGATPPAEGNVISREGLRPFQITSVKRGDDGQINIYAREITRGQ